MLREIPATFLPAPPAEDRVLKHMSIWEAVHICITVIVPCPAPYSNSLLSPADLLKTTRSSVTWLGS